jgi:hypothetical protein
MTAIKSEVAVQVLGEKKKTCLRPWLEGKEDEITRMSVDIKRTKERWNEIRFKVQAAEKDTAEDVERLKILKKAYNRSRYIKKKTLAE